MPIGIDSSGRTSLSNVLLYTTVSEKNTKGLMLWKLGRLPRNQKETKSYWHAAATGSVWAPRTHGTICGVVGRIIPQYVRVSTIFCEFSRMFLGPSWH